MSYARLFSLLIFLLCLRSAGGTSRAAGEQRPGSIRIGPVEIVHQNNAPDAFSLGHNYRVDEGGVHRGDLVTVAGDVYVDGEVTGNVVVLLGKTVLGPHAQIKHDLVVVGGELEADTEARVDGSRVSLLANASSFRWMREWVESGLLLGRPFPHQYFWAWVLGAAFLFVFIVLNLLLPWPVTACVSTLQERPGQSFVVGVLAFLVLGPLTLLLIVSGVGVLLLPFLLLALLVFYLFGQLTVYRFAGHRVGVQTGFRFLQGPLAALIVGTILFYALYAIPVVGFLVWGIVCTLGIGAVITASFRSFRASPASISASVPVLSSRFDPIACAADPPVDPADPLDPLPPAAAPGQPPQPKPPPERPLGPPPPPEPPPGRLESAPFDVLLLPRAGFWARLAATFLDGVLVAALMSSLHLARLIPLVWVLYHCGMWGWRGTTIGGIVMGLQIVRKNGQRINYGVALVRCLAAFFSALVLFLGFFWIGWDREKQGWHDKIAGTLVVKVPRAISLF